jgi:hypothetical protein
MKKHTLLLFCGLAFATANTKAQTWQIGSPNAADVTATLSGGTLTISGSGNMVDYVHHYLPNLNNPAPWDWNSINSVVIGTGVTNIGDYAFSGCRNLTSVSIPNGVTYIGEAAFESTKLTSVNIPSGVTSIGDYAFSFNTTLTSVTLPNGLLSIGDGAFNLCVNLTSLTIPASVQTLGCALFDIYYAGWYYSGCRFLTCLSPIPPPNTCHSMDSTFWENPSDYPNPHLCPLYVPASGVALYQSTYPWSNFDVSPIPGTTLSSVATLSSLSVSSGTFSFSFGSTTPSPSPLFSPALASSESTVTITATAEDPNATVAGTGVKPLNIGSNTFDIVVTAEDGITTKTYTFDLTREVPVEELLLDSIERLNIVNNALRDVVVALELDAEKLNDSIRILLQQLADCQNNGTTNANLISQEYLQVFPNPVSYELQIINYDFQQGDVVELFDMNGRRVYSAPANSHIGTFTVNLSNFQSGNYILRIGHRVAKIVKQ